MNERRSEAIELIAKMLPDSAMNRRLSSNDDTKVFAGEILDLSVDHAYADLWTRPGLDLRARSMITVAMMIAVRDTAELKIHVPAAVRNGVTIEELEELILHATGYVGFPAAASARQVMVESLTAAGYLS